MFFQVNLGSSQTFNQIEMNSGTSTGDYARGYNVEVSTNGTHVHLGHDRYRHFLAGDRHLRRADGAVHPGGADRRDTTNWWSIAEFTAFTDRPGGGGTPPPPTGGSLGPNVIVFTPSHVPGLDPEPAQHDR